MTEHIIPLPHVKSFAPYAFRHGEEPLDAACPHRTVGPCANRSEAHPSRIRQGRSAEPAIWLRCGHLRTRMKVRSGPFLIRCRGCEIRKEGQGPGLRRVRYERQLRAMCRYSLHTTRKSEVGVTIEARAAGRGGQIPGGNCGRYPRLGWRAREGPGLGQDGPKPGRPRVTRTDLPRRSRSRTRGCDRFSPMRSARPGSDSTAPSIMRSPASRPCRPRA